MNMYIMSIRVKSMLKIKWRRVLGDVVILGKVVRGDLTEKGT